MCASVVCRLFWSKSNRDPTGLKRTSAPTLLNYLEEFKLGVWSITRVITRNDFYLPIWQGKLIIAEHVFSMKLSSQVPRCLNSSLAQNIRYTSLSLSVLNPSGMQGLSLMYTRFPYLCTLSHVCMTIRFAKRPWG